MTKEIKNVVVAGPNGTLGQTVVRHLKDSGFNVTLLTRNLVKTKQDFPGLKAVTASYDSVDELSKVLREEVGKQDALVVLINRDQLQAQMNVMEAAAKAEITHIIPSFFGIGATDEYIRQFPIWKAKVEVEDYVVRKAEEGKLTYSGIQTGAFFDWALDRGIFISLKDDKAPSIFFDGGDVPFSASMLDDIGKAVAAALQKSDQCRNRSVFVHSAVVTQNQLLSYAREAAPERDFKVINVDTAVLEKDSWEKYNRGERGPEVMRGFMPRATFGKGMGLFHETDNELLGITQWTDDEVKDFVANYLK